MEKNFQVSDSSLSCRNSCQPYMAFPQKSPLMSARGMHSRMSRDFFLFNSNQPKFLFVLLESERQQDIIFTTLFLTQSQIKVYQCLKLAFLITPVNDHYHPLLQPDVRTTLSILVCFHSGLILLVSKSNPVLLFSWVYQSRFSCSKQKQGLSNGNTMEGLEKQVLVRTAFRDTLPAYLTGC